MEKKKDAIKLQELFESLSAKAKTGTDETERKRNKLRAAQLEPLVQLVKQK